jgi:peptidyl-prolyl cis-trans isomerase A (cyclophilin A)
VATSATSAGSCVSVVINHAAATSCIHSEMLAASQASHSMRNTGFFSGSSALEVYAVLALIGHPSRLRAPEFAFGAAGRLMAVALFAVAPVVMAQKVKLATSMGDIVVQLDAAKAPKSVANFVQYVKDGHYDGLIFHRVMPTFMIQGGGFDAEMKQKPTRASIPLESRNGLSNMRGTLAMARTMVPDSASSQFFINVVDNQRLDAANSPDGNGYAVFGKVVSGMDVVDKIRAVPTGPGDVPATPVTIKKATLEK